MRQHYKPDRADKPYSDAALGVLLALVIGTGLAWLLVKWWSA